MCLNTQAEERSSSHKYISTISRERREDPIKGTMFHIACVYVRGLWGKVGALLQQADGNGPLLLQQQCVNQKQSLVKSLPACLDVSISLWFEYRVKIQLMSLWHRHLLLGRHSRAYVVFWSGSLLTCIVWHRAGVCADWFFYGWLA